MKTLRDLLQEQPSEILQSHQGQLDSVAKRLEGTQQEMFRTLRTRIDQASDKVDRLESKMSTLEEQLEQLEKGQQAARPVASGTGSEDRATLIFGGWPKNSKRYHRRRPL